MNNKVSKGVPSRREAKATANAFAESLKASHAATAAGDHLKAAGLARRALIHKPGAKEAVYQLGLSLFLLDKFDEAILHLGQAAALYHDDMRVQMQYGIALSAAGRKGLALIQLDKASSMAGDIAQTAQHRADAAVSAVLPRLDFTHFDRIHRVMRNAILGFGAWCVGETMLASPYMDAIMQLMGATNYKGKDIAPLNGVASNTYRYAPLSGKLRIGFFGQDFNNTSTAWLTTAMIEAMKDIEHVETYAYDIGGPVLAQDMEGMTRERVEQSFDHFHNIKDLNDQEAADLIHSHGVNILLVMDSPARTRIGILARRPAALNVNYLYYPGTMGYDFIDAIVGDNTVIHQIFENTFSEKVIRLKGCYQPNDPSRPKPNLDAVQLYRQSLINNPERKLPEEATFLGNFNDSSKYTQDIIDLWAIMLRGGPARYLVLLVEKAHERRRLTAEFLTRGIGADRLIYVDKVPYPDHINRLRAMDIILDTHPYGGHTLTSDALWAGTPVVTMVGATFASRVAPSLLNALGLYDLTALSPNDYIMVATSVLEKDANGLRPALAKIRATLDKAREEGHELYDPKAYAKKFVNELEALLATVYNTNDGYHFETHAKEMQETFETGLAQPKLREIDIDLTEVGAIVINNGGPVDIAIDRLLAEEIDRVHLLGLPADCVIPELPPHFQVAPYVDGERRHIGFAMLYNPPRPDRSIPADELADDITALSGSSSVVHKGFRDDLMDDDDPEIAKFDFATVMNNAEEAQIMLGNLTSAVEELAAGNIDGIEVKAASLLSNAWVMRTLADGRVIRCEAPADDMLVLGRPGSDYEIDSSNIGTELAEGAAPVVLREAKFSVNDDGSFTHALPQELASAFWALENGELDRVQMSGVDLIPDEWLENANANPFFHVVAVGDTLIYTLAQADAKHKVITAHRTTDDIERLCDAVDALRAGTLDKITILDAETFPVGRKADLDQNHYLDIKQVANTFVITKRNHHARGETASVIHLDDSPYVAHIDAATKTGAAVDLQAEGATFGQGKLSTLTDEQVEAHKAAMARRTVVGTVVTYLVDTINDDNQIRSDIKLLKSGGFHSVMFVNFGLLHSDLAHDIENDDDLDIVIDAPNDTMLVMRDDELTAKLERQKFLDSAKQSAEELKQLYPHVEEILEITPESLSRPPESDFEGDELSSLVVLDKLNGVIQFEPDHGLQGRVDAVTHGKATLPWSTAPVEAIMLDAAEFDDCEVAQRCLDKHLAALKAGECPKPVIIANTASMPAGFTAPYASDEIIQIHGSIEGLPDGTVVFTRFGDVWKEGIYRGHPSFETTERYIVQLDQPAEVIGGGTEL